jgi:hypothetical protein
VSIPAEWPGRIVPSSAAARLDASRAVMTIERWRDIGDEQLRGELEDFFDAGWCVDALVRALHSRPDGNPQPQVRTARRVDSVRYRLNQWRGPDGAPAAPPLEAESGTGAQKPIEQDDTAAQNLRHREWPVSVVPETSDQHHAAVRALREAMRWSDVTANELLALVTPFFEAQWSVDCLRHAFTTSPLTGKPSELRAEEGKNRAERIAHRLRSWSRKSGLPKPPPLRTLSYQQWYDRQAESGTFDVRERRTSPSRAQVESVRQAREADERRKSQRVRDRVAEARDRDQAVRESLDALFDEGPAPEWDAPISSTAQSRHERLIEGIFYLEATDAGVIRWLRSIVEMDPDAIGPHTARVTRTRMRDARVQASLASLEQAGDGGAELSTMARSLADHVVGGPDLEAGQQVREMWQTLRTAFRDQQRRASMGVEKASPER